MQRLIALALLAQRPVSTPLELHPARAVCASDTCGIQPPPYLPPPREEAPRPLLPRRDLRIRLRELEPRVAECAVEHAPLLRVVHASVDVQPDGRWGMAFDRRVAEPDARGGNPFEVCVADWVASELGPRLEPARGRRMQRVAVRWRVR